MKKIKVTTRKELICEVDYSESTLNPDKVIESLKRENMIPEYNESYINLKSGRIQLFKYVHTFAVEIN
jgi:hypothetical protein